MAVVRSILCSLAMMVFSTAALADGKIYPRGIAVPPPIPDQQAIIAWDDVTSTQTLAIETRFAAVASSSASSSAAQSSDSAYAWIVPLPGPAAPRITAATPGLFPTVRAIFQPRVYDNLPGAVPPLLFLTAMLLLAVWITTRSGGSRLSSLISIGLVLLGFTCLAGLLLPTLGTARSSIGGAAAGVAVLSRETIGSYDITVIGADTSAIAPDNALAAWFKSNGFELPASTASVLAEYAAKSWVFAAVKLRPDAASSSAPYLTPHPLIFQFNTAAPVYPMRLTGIGNGPLTLDLYIFARGRASAPGLSEIRCDHCETDKYVATAWRGHRGGVIGIGHPTLKEIVGSLPSATKLSGTLTPAMQVADMPISFGPFERSGAIMHSPRAARGLGIQAALIVIPVAIVLLVIIGALRRLDGRFVLGQLWWVGLLATLAGIGTWMATPTVEVIAGGSRDAYRRDRDIEKLSELIHDSLRARGVVPTIEDGRAAAKTIIKQRGLDTREGDGPNEYTIEPGKQPGTIDFIARNWCGAPIPEQLLPLPPQRK